MESAVRSVCASRLRSKPFPSETAARNRLFTQDAAPEGASGLEEALQRVAADAKADHAARAVDVLDRLSGDEAAPAGEEPRANRERIRDVWSGAVHRTFDAADDATLVIGNEKPVEPTKIGSDDGGHPQPNVSRSFKGKLCLL